jgi:hypothetical protein
MVQAVACFELKRPMSFVSIAFLSCLGSFQIELDVVDNPLGLRDKVRTKYRSFTKLDLVPRCTATIAIQSFEGCHFETFLIVVVVRELSQWQTLFPFVRIVQYTSSEHILKNLIYSLSLSDHRFADDMPNYGSNVFLGKHAAAPRNE